jgi:hypothetical protein
MKIILGVTNHDVMRNIDVYLDGKLLDHGNYGIVMADDRTGEVEYIMFERGPDGQRRVVEEKEGDVEFGGDVIGAVMHTKLFKAQGQVVFDPRPWIPPRAFFDALSEANASPFG